MKIPTFLKWAGGKRRLIDQIDPFIPRNIDTYYEPFLGGASMFFYIKQKYNPKSCVLSDLNEDLIQTFKIVRDYPHKLIIELKKLKNKNSKEFYYKTRKEFNENKIMGIKRNAAFIYLNKTCFNGLWRVNLKGEFNVPYADYKNPEIYNEETIAHASRLLKGVIIKCQDYRNVLELVKKNDFVYLDPCYDPLKKTSFAKYNPKIFTEDDRIELAKFMRFLKNKNINVILSNNDIKEIRKIYSDFEVREILAPRFINSNGNGRGKIRELLIII